MQAFFFPPAKMLMFNSFVVYMYILLSITQFLYQIWKIAFLGKEKKMASWRFVYVTVTWLDFFIACLFWHFCIMYKLVSTQTLCGVNNILKQRNQQKYWNYRFPWGLAAILDFSLQMTQFLKFLKGINLYTKVWIDSICCKYMVLSF